MINISSTAMVLAAGLGTRLGQITKNTPKPLVAIGNTCCLDISIRTLIAAGFKRIVINTHYLAKQIEDYVKRYKNIEIILSYEPTLLETAGGVRKVLHEFNGVPFVVLNADMFWQDTSPSVITGMAESMQENDDFCLNVTPLQNTQGHSGKGDFMLDNGLLRRPSDTDAFDDRYVYTGIQIINPKVIEPLKVEPQSLRDFYFKASQSNTLRGAVYRGPWIDVSNVDGLQLARGFY